MSPQTTDFTINNFVSVPIFIYFFVREFAQSAHLFFTLGVYLAAQFVLKFLLNVTTTEFNVKKYI